MWGTGNDAAYPPPNNSQYGGQPPAYSQSQYGAPPPAPPPPQYSAPPPGGGYGQPPPPPGYGHPAPGGTMYHGTTVITQQPRLGDKPTRTKCPHCQVEGTTTVQKKVGRAALMCMGYLIFLGLCAFPPILLGFCFIPLCTMRDSHHTCPNCKKEVGVDEKMGGGFGGGRVRVR